MDTSFGLIIGILFIVGFIILLCVLLVKTKYSSSESEIRRAGRQGEIFAAELIKEILMEKDILLTNVKISFDGKDAELDSVVINNRGVFIIEVKNYVGDLLGSEDDYEWIKHKVTGDGRCFQKTVRNPIGQVKRQVYILSKYFKEYGIDVWVEGYVFLVNMNSPVDSDYVLKNQKDMIDAIHRGTNNNLTQAAVDKIVEVLED